MAGREQIAVVRHVPLSVLNKRIKHPKGLPQVVPRLVFIRLRYKGMSVVDAAETVGSLIRLVTTGRNAGTRRAGRAGSEVCRWHPSKLTDEQKAALLEKLREKERWTTAEVQRLIPSQFGVSYSLDQVRRILKSFGMFFGKPYPRDYRRPGMQNRCSKTPADEQEHGAWLLDECSPQTTANTQRMWSFEHADGEKYYQDPRQHLRHSCRQ